MWAHVSGQTGLEDQFVQELLQDVLFLYFTRGGAAYSCTGKRKGAEEAGRRRL